MIDRVTEYAKKVVSGEIKMGTLHTLAGKRHLDDFFIAQTPVYPFHHMWNAYTPWRCFDDCVIKEPGQELVDFYQKYEMYSLAFSWVSNDSIPSSCESPI